MLKAALWQPTASLRAYQRSLLRYRMIHGILLP